MEEERNLLGKRKDEFSIRSLSYRFVIVSLLLSHLYRDSVANKARNLNFMTAD